MFRSRVCKHEGNENVLLPKRTFLKNHIDGIAAIDLFVLPTITFQILYCLIILRHTRSLAGRGVPVNSGGRQ
jgi:hypothetical protein